VDLCLKGVKGGRSASITNSSPTIYLRGNPRLVSFARMTKATTRMRLCLALAFAGAALAGASLAPAKGDKFHEELSKAAKRSTLDEPGGEPFHMALTAEDTRKHNPDYSVEMEIWWAGPDRWRRSVKSAKFTQLAIRNGNAYYESNTSDYLPYWLWELIVASIHPVSTEAFEGIQADEDRPGCANWEDYHGSGEQKFSTYDSVCFGSNGEVTQIFAEPLGLQFGNYRSFGKKEVARQLVVFPGDNSEVRATVTVLEPLKDWKQPGGGGGEGDVFGVPRNTGFASRLRFAAVAESALTPAGTRAPLNWPSSYVFPVEGVIGVTVQLDREGNIQEFPWAISKNQRINQGAVEQIKTWKFEPYLVDGAAVQVVTTLTIPYRLKYEPLGANGKEFPPISFHEHILKYEELSNLRAPGGTPFHMRGRFTLADRTAGTYEETWKSPDEWERDVMVGENGVRVRRISGRTSSETIGSPNSATALTSVAAAVDNHFPDPGTFQEGDWGNSAVPATNVDPTKGADMSEPVLIRAARGGVDANNHPTSGEAYWFDSAGLLRAWSVNGTTVVNSEFSAWKLWQVPHEFEIFRGSNPLGVLTLDSVDPL